MTKADKKKFLKTFLKQVGENILSRLSDIPEDWDGFELRWLVADTFSRETEHFKEIARAGRKREYRNAVITKNLI